MQAPGSLLLSCMCSSMNTIDSIRMPLDHRSGHTVHPCVCLHNELSVPRKLAQKRKETMSSTRQEMTVMVSSMDKSYAEQGTSCDEAFSFMDTHNLNGRCEWAPFPPSRQLWGPGVRKQNLPRQFLGGRFRQSLQMMLDTSPCATVLRDDAAGGRDGSRSQGTTATRL